jgi:RNA polymerase sigma-70 factor (ECF subfamily)
MSEAANDVDTFEADLIALIPSMRAFSRSLCSDPTQAEDLAQEGLARAWAARTSFAPGTNLKAWTFVILRNQYYSEKRRSWRSTPLDPDIAERSLAAVDNPLGHIELDELRRALNLLPDNQREALILIGAGGFSYEEAGEICGGAVGTIKSRVSRARRQLSAILAEGFVEADDQAPGQAMSMIMGQMNAVHRRQSA